LVAFSLALELGPRRKNASGSGVSSDLRHLLGLIAIFTKLLTIAS